MSIQRLFFAHTPSSGHVEDLCENGMVLAMDSQMSYYMDQKSDWQTSIGGAEILMHHNGKNEVIIRELGFPDRAVPLINGNPAELLAKPNSWFNVFWRELKNKHSSIPFYHSKSWPNPTQLNEDGLVPGVMAWWSNRDFINYATPSYYQGQSHSSPGMVTTATSMTDVFHPTNPHPRGQITHTSVNEYVLDSEQFQHFANQMDMSRVHGLKRGGRTGLKQATNNAVTE